ncbi:MAG: hypothetical protein JWQ90_3417 [Hydrocarboniphaga sp.]|uniref:hypothetical protein n=1 Tax=Hydrocarboniphaga sp. TaxID=2033016 RepID=UPI00261C63EA|nr:hypothetical protein [Hydrocarboniphaga sp.]MDB5970967.1 hypothetical protein [Hydrocarboniphaga sp.]
MYPSLNVHGGRASGHRALFQGSSHIVIPLTTGPLDILPNKRALILLDVANLHCGAKTAGYELSFGTLASLLKAKLGSADLHAFFARKPNDSGRGDELEGHGYHTHAREVEYVKTVRGMERKSNCDNDLLFVAGVLLATMSYDLVVAGTGDGDLALDLARGVRAFRDNIEIVSLGFAHNSAWRLHTGANRVIDGNILIGADCLQLARIVQSDAQSISQCPLLPGALPW